jgi:hypothetical protein
LNSEATSKRIEASPPHTGAIVAEDGVLVLWSVGVHAWWRESEETKSGREWPRLVQVNNYVFLRQATVQENEQRDVEKNSMYE